MQILNQLERKFGRFAIPNITGKLVMLQVIVFIIAQFQGVGKFFENYTQLLNKPALGIFNPLGDTIGCLVSPPTWSMRGISLLFLYFGWMIFLMCGNTLEEHWGTFRYNMYIVVYVLLNIVLSTVLRNFVGDAHFLSLLIATNSLYLGVFLAFATLVPNYEFLMFFILPVKVKILAWLGVASLLHRVFVLIKEGAWLISGLGTLNVKGLLWGILLILVLMLLIPLIQYAFFIAPLLASRSKQMARKREFTSKMNSHKKASRGIFHKCSVCGITDSEAPELEFRVAANGEDRCEKHLRD